MATLDPDALKQFQFLVFTKLEGAVTSGMIHLGDRLGLYRALADAGGPLTSAELAAGDRARRAVGAGVGLQPGRGQGHQSPTATTRVGRERFSLTPEAAAVLASPGPRGVRHGHVPPPAADDGDARGLPESFRTGLGHDYDSHGPEGAVGIERSFEPWNRAHLLPDVLPDAGRRGRPSWRRVPRVVDIGCGAGGAVLLMAGAFPASTFTGYDISQHALDRADAAAGRDRARPTPRSPTHARQPLPTDHSRRPRHDVRLHPRHDRPAGDDARHPRRRRRRRHVAARRHQGASTRSPRTSRKNPMASLMYGISVLSCMSSALSEPGGAGLGTLGLPASKAEAMARDAGFTQVPRAARRPRRERLLRDPAVITQAQRRFGPDRGRAGDHDPDQDASGCDRLSPSHCDRTGPGVTLR